MKKVDRAETPAGVYSLGSDDFMPSADSDLGSPVGPFYGWPSATGFLFGADTAPDSRSRAFRPRVVARPETSSS